MFLAVKALRTEEKLELATKLRSASYARQADTHGHTRTFVQRTIAGQKESHRFARKKVCFDLWLS